MAGVRSGNVGKKQHAVTVWSWTASRLSFCFIKFFFPYKKRIIAISEVDLALISDMRVERRRKNYKTFLWIKFNFLDERHWTSPL